MARVAVAAYTPYVVRMGGQHPGPLDADYEAVVSDTEAWVAESDGEVIGFLVLIGEDDGMLLDNVAVLPWYQGRGAGRALLRLAEQQARARGNERIRLYTHATMVENQALYEKIGYAETGRTHDHGFDRVFYEKVLTGNPDQTAPEAD